MPAPDLTELTLEDGVQTLGELCFYGCTALTAVRIPGSVAELRPLSSAAAPRCARSRLKTASRRSASGAFQECRALTELTLPESLRSVGGGAFFACTGLASLRLPEGLERVGDEAFLGCLALDPAALSLPTSLKSVGRRAFACGSLLSGDMQPERRRDGRRVLCAGRRGARARPGGGRAAICRRAALQPAPPCRRARRDLCL